MTRSSFKFSVSAPQSTAFPNTFSAYCFLCICLLLGNLGSWGCFLTAFSVPISLSIFLTASSFFVILWATLLFPWPRFRELRFKQHLPLIGLLALIFLFLLFFKVLYPGLVLTINLVIESWKAREELELQSLPLAEIPSALWMTYLQCFLFWSSCLYALAGTWLLIRKNSGLYSFLLSLALPALPLAFTIIPRLWPVILLLLFWTFLLFRDQLPLLHLKSLFPLAPVLAMLLLLTVTVPPSTYQRDPAVEALRLRLLDFDFSWESIQALLTGKSEGNKGSLSSDLSSASRLNQSSDPALQIFSTEPRTDFLKGFAGGIYNNGRWELLPSNLYNDLRTKLSGMLPQQFPIHFTSYFPMEEDGGFYQILIRHTDPNDLTVYAPYGAAGEQDLLVASGLLTVQDSGFRAKEALPDGYTFLTRPVSYTTYPQRLGGIPTEKDPVDQPLWFASHQIARQDLLSLTDLQLTSPVPEGALKSLLAAENYVDLVYDYYLAVPTELERHLDAYCYQHGLSADNYSTAWEAAEMVARILQSENLYDTNPGALPEGKDPVLWFLQENHKGYCMHFASSAVMILRSMDIPARFASGYKVLYEDFQSVPGEDYYVATLSYERAHAWVEVYASGFGWVPVEVTPSGSTAVLPSPAPMPSEPETQPEENESEENTQEESKPDAPSGSPQDPSDPEVGLPSGPSLWETVRFWGLRLGSLFLAALLLLLNRVLHRLWRNRLFSQADRNKAGLECYRYLLKLLSCTEKAPECVPEPIKELALRARFSQHTLTEEEIQQLRDYAEQLRKLADTTLPPVKRFCWRYLLGRI